MTRGLDFAPARRADAATNPAPTRTRCTRLRRGTQTCCYQPKTSPTPVRSSPAHLARFATTALYPIGVAVLLEKIVADEEEHIDYLETQLELMDKLGEELYSAQCVSRPPT